MLNSKRKSKRSHRYRSWLAIAIPVFTCVACATSTADGPKQMVERYIAAINRDDPQAAYALLGEQVQRQITAAEFAARWKQVKPELRRQASQLGSSAERPMEIGATVTYRGGTRARLRFADGQWRIDGGISVSFQTATPLEALRTFIRAVERRSYDAVLKLLSRSVRQSIERDINDRLAKLKRWLGRDGEVEITGDRARVRYDARYKIELVNEDGQWKILDFD